MRLDALYPFAIRRVLFPLLLLLSQLCSLHATEPWVDGLELIDGGANDFMPRFTEIELPQHPNGRWILELNGHGEWWFSVRDGRVGQGIWMHKNGKPISSKSYRWIMAREGDALLLQMRNVVDGSGYRFTATVTDTGVVSGTWSFREQHDQQDADASGALSARSQLWEEARSAEMPLAGELWPGYAGPVQRFYSRPQGHDLVDDIRNLRPVWRSEALLPSAIGSISRVAKGRGIRKNTHAGGSSSPILGGGNLYLSYFKPGVEVADKISDYTEALYENGESIFERYERLWGETYGARAVEFEKRRWALEGREALICIDPQSGETLWDIDMGPTLNLQGHKGGPNNFTPLYYQGKVYTLSNLRQISCVDAASGTLLWQTEPQAGMLSTLRQALESKTVYDNKRWGRTAPIVAGDRLLVVRNGLECRDVTSGQLLWSQSSVDMVPAIWQHQGRLYVITRKGDGTVFHCIDLLTGQVIWEEDSLIQEATQNLTLGLEGDSFAFYEGSQDLSATVVLGTLSLQGMSQTLRTPQAGEVMNAMYPVIREGLAYISAAGGTYVYRCSDGQLLKHEAGLTMRRNGHFQMHEDKILVVEDGRHGVGPFYWADSDVNALNPGSLFTPPHYPTSAYSVAPMHHAYADGRLFIRGSDGLYCYDLRKASAQSNQTPVAAIASLPGILLSGTLLDLDGSASSDVDGSIAEYRWSFGGAAADQTGASVMQRFDQPGQYRITLQVTDHEGLSAHADHWITVLDANTNAAPVALVSVSPKIGSFPLMVEADASASYDLDGGTLQFTWTWPDGETTTGAQTQRQVDLSGSQSLHLLIEDGQGGSTEHVTLLRSSLEPVEHVIWQEDFSGLVNGAKQDSGDSAWSSTGPGSVQGEVWQSAGGSSEWLSESIDVSALTEPAFSVSLDSPDIGAFESSDVISIAWSLDGAPFVEAISVSRIHGLEAEAFTVRVGTGNRLVIRVQALSSSSNEIYEVEDVRVFDLVQPVPTKPELRMSWNGTSTGAEAGPEILRVRFERRYLEELPVTLQFSIAGGVSDADFSLAGADSFRNGQGTLSFAAGELQKEFVLTPLDDGLEEGTESLQISLLEDAAYELAEEQGRLSGEILDAQTNYAPRIHLLQPASGQLELADQFQSGNLAVSVQDDRTAAASISLLWSTQAGPGQALFETPDESSSSVSFPSYGEYTLRITATDRDGLSSFRDVEVLVIDGLNQAPNASFTLSSTEGEGPLELQLDASASSDPDADPLNYAWSFSDGGSASGAQVTHTFLSPNTYSITLTVTDGRGGSDQSQQNVVVTPPVAKGEVIWKEDFSLANGAQEDDGDTAWSLNPAQGALSVLEGELHGSNLDELFTWSSELIDISAGKANFSLQVRGSPVQELEDSDLLRVLYKVDGGATVLVGEWKGAAIGDAWRTILQQDIHGDTLQILIELINSSGAEHHYIDNVTVRIEAPSTGYSPAQLSDWLASAPPGLNIDSSLDGFSEKANGLTQNGALFAFGIESLDPAYAQGKLPWHSFHEQDGNLYFQIHFRRRNGGDGNAADHAGYEADQVRYIVECSTDLIGWDGGAEVLELAGSTDNGDGTHTDRVRVKAPISDDLDGKEFLRVRLEDLSSQP